MVRIAGFSGTVFRLQGGSLVEGEDAPFDKVVYRYSIIDGIRDGYLVPAFSAPAMDKLDVSKLRIRSGEYTGESQDAQMIDAMDNHICQLLPHKNTRRKWLLFEASVKAAITMTERLNQWGIKACCVHGEMSADQRESNIAAYRRRQYQALVNKDICTTGFDDQEIDLLVMRFLTTSLGKYTQVIGRLLRTIGGNIEASIRAGKPDGLLYDFGGNVDRHGPLDFLRPKDTVAKLVSCESCGKRNAVAAMRCWSCSEPMTKNCPACLVQVQKGVLDCPKCKYDMRTGSAGEARPAQKLLDTPSGAALISAWAKGRPRDGGWLPISRTWKEGETTVAIADYGDNATRHEVTGLFVDRIGTARWLRLDPSTKDIAALLLPNGLNRTSALQVTADGTELPVPMPRQSEAAA